MPVFSIFGNCEQHGNNKDAKGPRRVQDATLAPKGFKTPSFFLYSRRQGAKRRRQDATFSTEGFKTPSSFYTQGAKGPREGAKTPLLAPKGFKTPSFFLYSRRQGTKDLDTCFFSWNLVPWRLEIKKDLAP